MKKALILGISGQDGSYLSRFFWRGTMKSSERPVMRKYLHFKILFVWGPTTRSNWNLFL